jgi:hypothetical protein
VRSLAHEAATHAPHLLARLPTAAALVAAENALRHAIDAWRAPVDAGNASNTGIGPLAAGTTGGAWPHAPSTPLPTVLSRKLSMMPGRASVLPGTPSIAAAATPRASGAAISTAPASWDTTCELVIGTRLPLWQSVFQPLFMTRAKELLSAKFDAVLQLVPEQLDQHLQAAAAAAAAAAGTDGVGDGESRHSGGGSGGAQMQGQVRSHTWPHAAHAGGAVAAVHAGGDGARGEGLTKRASKASPGAERCASVFVCCLA